MSAQNTSEAAKLAASFRLASRPASEAASNAFLSELLQRALELQHKHPKDYEELIGLIVRSLEHNQLNEKSPALELNATLLSVLATVNLLMDLELTSGQFSICYNYIRQCLMLADATTASKAADAFGKYMSLSNPNDPIRRQIGDAVQWMGDIRTESGSSLRKLKGVLLLQQTAIHMPLVFIPLLNEFFNTVWVPLSDGQSELRDRALEVFRSGMRILHSRPRKFQAAQFDTLFEMMKNNLTSKSVDSVIGGLLAFEDIVMGCREASSTRRYEDVFKLVWELTTHSVIYVRLLTMRALTTVARYDTPAFRSGKNLKDVVNYALDATVKDAEMSGAFKLLGEIIHTVGKEAYEAHLDQTIHAIKKSLINQKRTPNKPPTWEALECLATICSTMPSEIVEAHVKSCIEHVFTWGLSESLIRNLKMIVKASSHDTQDKVQEHLLDIISITLCGMQYRQRAGQDLMNAAAIDQVSSEKIVVALNALAEFNFTNSEPMGDFIRDSVISFVDHEKHSVRMAAISTIAALLFPTTNEVSIARRIVVDYVLQHLLVTAVADADVRIRTAIFQSFHPRFHPYLAETQFLHHIFTAVSDECFEVRLEALKLICVILELNPSHILPALRREFIIVTNGLASSHVEMVSESLRLLSCMSQYAPSIVTKFQSSVCTQFEVLLPHIARNAPVAVPLMESITWSAKAMGTKFPEPLAHKILDKICDFISNLAFDKSIHNVKLVGLRCIAAVLSYSDDDGVSPYKRHPSLFKLITTIVLSKEDEQSCRTEALRIFGIVGALDPHRLKALEVDTSDANIVTHSDGMFGELSATNAAKVVMAALSDTVNPQSSYIAPNTQSLMRSAIKTLLLIAERCPSSNQEMHSVFPSIVEMLLDMPRDRLFTTILFEVPHLISIAERDALTHADDFLRLFHGCWEHEPSRVPVLKILTALIQLEADDETPLSKSLPSVLPKLEEELGNGDNEPLRATVMEFLLCCDYRLQTFANSLTRKFVGLIESTSTKIQFQTVVLAVVRQLSRKGVFHDYAAPIIRATISTLTHYFSKDASGANAAPAATENSAFVQEAIGVFVVFALQLQGDFGKFVPATHRLLRTHHIQHSEYQYICSQVLRGSNVALNQNAEVKLASHYRQLRRDLRDVGHFYMQGQVEVWATESSDSTVSNNMSITSNGGTPGREYSADRTRRFSGDALTNNSPFTFTPTEELMPINESRIVERTQQTPTEKKEWIRWYDALCLDILRESPYYIYRCVSLHINSQSIAERAPGFVNVIFNPAFRCMWTHATPNLRHHLKECFERVLPNNLIPDDVVLSILSVVEYMDLVINPLPIPTGTISSVAQSKGVLAKALAFCEKAYRETPGDMRHSLITLYGELRNIESAMGLLSSAQSDEQSSQYTTLLLKLGKYTEALSSIEDAIEQIESPTKWVVPKPHRRTRSWSTSSGTAESFANVEDSHMAQQMQLEVSKVECLSELGDMHSVLREWRNLHQQLSPKKSAEDEDEEHILHYVAAHAADAAVRLKEWDTTRDALHWIREDDIRHRITAAALSIHDKDWDAALSSITKGRELLLNDVTGLLHESYNRAYDTIVIAQQLVEMEETVEVLRMDPTASWRDERVARLQSQWLGRIVAMKPSVTNWKRVLGTRNLLVDPRDDIPTLIKFVRLCREQGQSSMERYGLEQMIGTRGPSKDLLLESDIDSRVVFEFIKHLSLSNELGKHTPYGDEKELVRELIQKERHRPGSHSLVAHMYVRYGELMDLKSSIEQFKLATEVDPKWSRGWHQWATANADMLNHRYSDAACFNAIDGFVKSICLAPNTSAMIQDVLRLLSLWNQHCDHTRALAVLREKLQVVEVQTWLLVVPQLIAKLDTGSDASCELTAQILTRIAKERPQNLIYPLTVCTSSNNVRRKEHATAILKAMREIFPEIVAQGSMVTDELIRIAVMVPEQWFAAFEESATAFFTKKDSQAMVDLLLPLHDKMNDNSPETLVEVEFYERYGRQLRDARDWLRSFQKTKDDCDLHSAWHIYHAVYKSIDVTLKASSKLNLQYCSPRLWEAKGLQLTVPQARPKDGSETIGIAAFSHSMAVISSKQRPRRIAMIGTDGRTYKFLLKGKEDLRLDERVMQLFKLVNTLLLTNANTNKVEGYQIQRYSVTPLWDMVGLLGWVEECDTMHELVASYRSERDVPVETEMRMMHHIISAEFPKAYDVLSQMQKVEVLEYLQDHTSGQDLRRAMWIRATTAEVWLSRRTTYVRSLATMSMVGYILGLGDRHPNNIMIQRSTGKVVHIDFGDCFEVAMTRDKFPERVPFRLTRMLRNAMEVCGVEGLYRTSAENVMSVLRESRGSVVAMLEAFIHDPLISWRLVNKQTPSEEAGEGADHMEEMENSMASPTLRHNVSVSQRPEREESLKVANQSEFNKTVVFASSIEERAKKRQEKISHEGIAILRRLESKLRGTEFRNAAAPKLTMDTKAQVARLITEATDVNNVSQSWSGWYPFW